MRYRAVLQGSPIPEKHSAPVYERLDSHLGGELFLVVIQPFTSEDPRHTGQELDERHRDA